MLLIIFIYLSVFRLLRMPKVLEQHHPLLLLVPMEKNLSGCQLRDKYV